MGNVFQAWFQFCSVCEVLSGFYFGEKFSDFEASVVLHLCISVCVCFRVLHVYLRLCPTTAGRSPLSESSNILCPLLSLSIPFPVAPQCHLSNDVLVFQLLSFIPAMWPAYSHFALVMYRMMACVTVKTIIHGQLTLWVQTPVSLWTNDLRHLWHQITLACSVDLRFSRTETQKYWRTTLAWACVLGCCLR